MGASDTGAQATVRDNALTSAAASAAEQMREAENRLAAWQAQWDAYAKAGAESAQAAEVERTRLDYLDRQSLESGRRLETLRAEKGAADFDTLNRSIEQLGGEPRAHAVQRSLAAAGNCGIL